MVSGMVTFSSEDLCLHGLFPVYFTVRWVTSVRPITLRENKRIFFVRKYFWRPPWSFPGEFEVSVFFLTENQRLRVKKSDGGSLLSAVRARYGEIYGLIRDDGDLEGRERVGRNLVEGSEFNEAGGRV